MLSAHQPYARFPEQMKIFAREVGATAQVAGGVPAMCDGVTQGQDGMDLSLFSRDVIAMSTAVALSHGMFEGAALLGICDKIVPGPADRRAPLRAPADAAGAGRADAVGPAEQGKAARPPALRRGQGRAATSCSRRSRQAIIRRAPAPSTAPPIPTR
jgi:dihydroxyacid dehydratase/phosphogluconate dehydratase